jgi:hypothetical protein
VLARKKNAGGAREKTTTKGSSLGVVPPWAGGEDRRKWQTP